MPKTNRPARIALATLLLATPVAMTTTTARATETVSPTAGAVARDSGYDARIRITEHGIPHIKADSFADLAYGAGWATTSAATCTLMDTLLTARGLRSKYEGPEASYNDRVGGDGTNLQWDTVVTDIRDRKVVETLLADKVAGPSPRAKSMVRAEVAGINEWLRTHEITDPACADKEWIRPDVTTLDIWYAMYLAQLIGSTTRFLTSVTDAAPPTGRALRETPSARTVDREALLDALGQDPAEAFGSNATAVGKASTSTKRGMLLGNPHFPWVGRYRFTQMHLTVPGKLNVAGGSLIGFPTVNIGFNKDVAWSHTVSTGYRFTPYQYRTAGSPTSYRTAGGKVAELEKRVVEIPVRTDDGVETVSRTLYRTPQGYVVNAPALFMSWSPDSFWAMRDANAEHLRTLDTFLSMAQADSVRDLLKRQDKGGGMPWVNTIAADRAGDVLYADHSVVPNVTDRLAQKCMTSVGRLIHAAAGLPGLDGTRADTACRWGTDKDAQRPGILGPKNLPGVVRRDWVMNANDSYWLPNDDVRLTGYPRIVGCESCERSMRTKVVMAYVRDRLAKGKETPRTFRSHQYANRVYAAEVARAGGRLDRVCAATGETDACQVLADWDGRSDTTSVGTVLFEEFVRIASSNKVNLWEVPFSRARPLTTPRRLSTSQDVVDTMAEAIRLLSDKGVDLHAPYGTQHTSGDRGDEGIAIGGGLGNLSGDANATSGGGSALGGVTTGSSHIQAISFRGRSGVDARTVLTYSQFEDPGSPWARDQTQIFSDERWVRFAWTPAQIREDLVETIRLGG